MRLLKRSDFAKVSALGRRFYSRLFVVLVLKQEPPAGSFRLGLAVGRKIGKAVWRNRIKRLVREYFRLNQAAVSPELDIVLIPKSGLDPRSLDYAMLCLDLQPLWHRFGTHV